MKHAANILTVSRIILSLILFCFPPFTLSFFVLYIFCGISDMLDGTIARKTGTVSEFGAKLDSIADIMFVLICMIKILPVIEFKIYIWVCIAVIAFIRILNIILGFVFRKKLVMLHTTANKITGILLFIFPLTILIVDINLAAIPVCSVAAFASVQEGYFIININSSLSDIFS